MRKDITPKRKYLIDRLGQMRTRAKLSGRELSGRLGNSDAYIAKFENGDFNIPSEMLLEAIEICGSSPEEFFYDDLANYAEHKQIIEKYKALSDESKITLINLLNNMK